MPAAEDLRLDASYRNLDRAISWGASAENKAGAVFTANSVLLGLVGVRLSDGLSVLWRGGDSLALIGAVALLGHFGAVSYSLFRALSVFRPDTRERDESLFFFGSIAKLSRGEFEKRMSALDPATTEAEINRQTHIISGIVSRKFEQVSKAIKWFGIAFVLAVLCLVLRGFERG